MQPPAVLGADYKTHSGGGLHLGQTAAISDRCLLSRSPPSVNVNIAFFYGHCFFARSLPTFLRSLATTSSTNALNDHTTQVAVMIRTGMRWNILHYIAPPTVSGCFYKLKDLNQQLLFSKTYSMLTDKVKGFIRLICDLYQFRPSVTITKRLYGEPREHSFARNESFNVTNKVTNRAVN